MNVNPYAALERLVFCSGNETRNYRVLYAILTKDEILVFKIVRRETAYV